MFIWYNPIKDNNNLAGVNAISFDTGGLPPGVYIYIQFNS